MAEEFDAERLRRECQRIADTAARLGKSMQRLSSATIELGMVIREGIDSAAPDRPTAAKEIGEAAILRAQKRA